MNLTNKEKLSKHVALLVVLILTLASCNSTPSTPIDDPAPDADATVIREAQFQDADAAHQGSGKVSILEEGEKRTLRFENFKSTNGPGLRVLLVEKINGNNQGSIGDYKDLGALKSINGNQNYNIPKEVDLSKYTGVMIYCEPFHVVFSRAIFQ